MLSVINSFLFSALIRKRTLFFFNCTRAKTCFPVLNNWAQVCGCAVASELVILATHRACTSHSTKSMSTVTKALPAGPSDLICGFRFQMGNIVCSEAQKSSAREKVAWKVLTVKPTSYKVHSFQEENQGGWTGPSSSHYTRSYCCLSVRINGMRLRRCTRDDEATLSFLSH